MFAKSLFNRFVKRKFVHSVLIHIRLTIVCFYSRMAQHIFPHMKGREKKKTGRGILLFDQFVSANSMRVCNQYTHKQKIPLNVLTRILPPSYIKIDFYWQDISYTYVNLWNFKAINGDFSHRKKNCVLTKFVIPVTL